MGTSKQTSRSLTFDQAVEVWQLRSEGWFQDRIAARFDVNSARVNDVLKERKHRGSRSAAERGGDQPG